MREPGIIEMSLIQIIKPLLFAIFSLSLITGLAACDEPQSIVHPDNPPSEQSPSKDQTPPSRAISSEKIEPSNTRLGKPSSLSPHEGERGAGLKGGPRIDNDAKGPLTNEAAPSLKSVMKNGEALNQTHYGDFPLWSSNRRFKAHENARNHYEKHGPVLGVKSYEDYIALSHGFIHNPPKGTEIINRYNGDKLYYNAELNIFAVATQKGAPRTLFRPDNGRAYWQKQKQIEAGRRTLKSN